MERDVLARLCRGWQLKNQVLSFTNGCFDILHRGHIEVLTKAANEGNRLIVGLNSDASVRRLKGQARPINGEADRAMVLAALQFVDAVCLFDEDTPLELIQDLKPDVIVKGGDYTEETVVGHDFVKSYGGRTVIVPLIPGRSTTSIIEQFPSSH